MANMKFRRAKKGELKAVHIESWRDCRINNYHGLCGSEPSMFTIHVAVRDDDVDDVFQLPVFE